MIFICNYSSLLTEEGARFSASASKLAPIFGKHTRLASLGDHDWITFVKPGSLWSSLDHFGQIWIIWVCIGRLVKSGTLWSYLDHFGHFWIVWSNLDHICILCHHVCTSWSFVRTSCNSSAGHGDYSAHY